MACLSSRGSYGCPPRHGKKKTGAQGAPEGWLAEVTRKLETLSNGVPLNRRDGGGLAGLQHWAVGLKAGGSAVVGHAGGDADHDHGDRCDERYGHDLQVGRAISGNERMVHGISPPVLSIGRAGWAIGSKKQRGIST